MTNSIIIETKGDGVLAGPSAVEIREFFDGLTSADDLVVVLHGGLVPPARALPIIQGTLQPRFEKAGLKSLFFLWHSGMAEVLANNLGQVARDPFFERLLHKLLKFVASKIVSPGLIKGPGDFQVSDIQVQSELQKLTPPAGDRPAEPFGELNQKPPPAAPTAMELQALADEITADVGLAMEVPKLSAALARKKTKSSRYRMDREVAARMTTRPDGTKSPITLIALAAGAVKVAHRVFVRLHRQRDHGVYPTVVEELAREFFLADFGGLVWATMKQETLETFAAPAGQKRRGGRVFLEELGDMVASGRNPRISIVGHSAGCVFAGNLIEATADRVATGRLPVGFAYDNLVYLAPACTQAHFAASTLTHPALYRDFRVLTMTDEAECADQLVPKVYTRSLLYLISGVLERDAAGESLADCEVLGMQRYLNAPAVYGTALNQRVAAYLQGKNRLVFSPTSGATVPGFSSTSHSHADFATDGPTLDSIVAIAGRAP